MRILIKYPTRARPQQFLTTLKGWMDGADDLNEVRFICNFDWDDTSMTPDIVKRATDHGATIFTGKSTTKIMACNEFMNQSGYFDVVLLVSDDMICRRKGWDTIIRQKMMELYPDTDGCLWFHDGSKQREISTLSCMGRAYFERFHYLYHPSYASFWCDNEYTDVARSLNKITFIEQPIALHEHPAWMKGVPSDDLYRRNNKYWQQDKLNYERRKSAGFPA